MNGCMVLPMRANNQLEDAPRGLLPVVGIIASGFFVYLNRALLSPWLTSPVATFQENKKIVILLALLAAVAIISEWWRSRNKPR